MKLQITCSGGGPLIAIPAELAQHWRGTLPPLDAIVPAGWQWGASDEITCDYDRACYEMEDFAENGYAGFGWLNPAGTEGLALVLDAELLTTFLPQKNGGVIIRNFPTKDDNISSETAQILVDKIAKTSWKEYPKTITLKDGRIFIFDSAYQGCAEASDITADDGVCVAKLQAGTYSIKYASNKDETEFIYLENTK